MSFPRYPKYKAASLPWVSEIPSHWSVSQVRFLLVEGRDGIRIGPFGSSIKVEDLVTEGPKVYGQENVIYRDFTAGDRRITESHFHELSDYEIRSGDVLVTMAGTAGRCQVVPHHIDRGIMDSHLVRMRFGADSVYAPMIPYLVESAAYVVAQINVAGRGTTMQGLNSSIVKRLVVGMPTLPEQKAIASFLDRETAKIDALIAEQQRLIQLLQEKRQAVISHAVTKGLNPDVPMKDSGIEWLGQVPEHWGRVRIKYCLHGLVDTEHKTAPFYEDGSYLVVRTTNIKNGQLVLEDAKYTDSAAYVEWTRRGAPKVGDIMFTREAPAGEACLVPADIPLCMGQRTVLMQIDHDVLDSHFALWSLYGGLASEFVAMLSQGSTVVHFNMSDIGNIPLMLPPICEQREIARRLTITIDRLVTLAVEAEQTISLLQERRSALISAAVTGQIDVRGIAGSEAA